MPRTLALAAALAVGAGPRLAGAATVTLPALVGGQASVRLVELARQDRQVLGFAGPEWATAYSHVALDSGASLTLTPTARIATPGTLATCYQVTITAPGSRTATYCVQVLDQEAPQPLASLVGAAPIDGASIPTPHIATSTATAVAVRLPALAGATASIRLVKASDPRTQVLGFHGVEWATTYVGLALDAAQLVTLTPTAAIALAGGGATCYLVSVSAPGGRAGDFCVQVPATDDTLDLASLAGAASIDGADILAGRLLPLPGTAGIGWALTLDEHLVARWSAPGDGPAALAWGAITGTPTTLAGYGITDAVGSSDARLSDARTPTAHSQAWSTITSTPTTRAGYGIGDVRGLADTSSIIFGRDTDVIAVNDSYTIAWPLASAFVAVTCDVMTAPVGAAIGLDVRVGSPLASIYTSGHALTIPAGATSTLDGPAPVLIQTPTPIHARQPVQIIVTGVGLSTAGKGLRCTILETLPCC